MHFLNQILFRGNNPWKWVLTTMLPAALPMIISIVTATNRAAGFDEYKKIEDVIFMGLSTNISSINVWAMKLPVRRKLKGLSLAIFYLIVLTCCLAQSQVPGGISVQGKIVAITVVILSAYENLDINASPSNRR